MISALVMAVTLLLAAAAEQVGQKRPKRKPSHPVEYRHQIGEDEVVMVRVVYVDLLEVYEAGLIPEYEAMRDFVDRSFSVVHIDAAADLRDDQEMWIWLPAPPKFQKRGAFKRLVERWPMFVDPELAALSLERSKPVDALIRRNGGKVVPYRDLPPEAQLAIAHYMSIDGEAWDPPPWVRTFWNDRKVRPADPADTAEWRKRFVRSRKWFVDRHGDVPFGWVLLPMRELTAVVLDDVLRSHLDVEEGETFADFDEYHEWYKRAGPFAGRGQPEGKGTVWPVILDTNASAGHEPLQDGWHRFHQYYDQGLEVVPAVYYP